MLGERGLVQCERIVALQPIRLDNRFARTPGRGRKMLTGLVESVNERLRERQSRELQRNIDSIDAELAKSTEVRDAIWLLDSAKPPSSAHARTLRSSSLLGLLSRPGTNSSRRACADIEPCVCVRVPSWSAVFVRFIPAESENDRRQL
jgi:hypothetical protein